MSHLVDPAIEGLASAAADALPRMLSAIEHGHVPAWHDAIGDAEFSHGLELVKTLFASDELVTAAPLALLLAVCRPTHARCTYLAGRIFQKLKSWQVAAWLYALCAPVANASVVLYRLGQCLKSIGQSAAAGRIFERAYDMARDDDDSGRLQSLIERQLLALS